MSHLCIALQKECADSFPEEAYAWSYSARASMGKNEVKMIYAAAGLIDHIL